MKKIFSFIMVVLITIISTMNVNAFWTYADKTHMNINGKHIWTWKQIYMYWEKDNTLYFRGRNVLSDWKNEYKYYKFQEDNLIEIEEFEDNKTDYSDSENWTIWSHYSQTFNEDKFETTIKIDWMEYGPYLFDYVKINDISNKAFYYNMWNGTWEDTHYVFTYFDEIETKLKSNPKVDLLLNKIFIKVDKKWDIKAKIIYNTLIEKIDKILAKNISNEKIEVLEYIKLKLEEKVEI